MNGGFMLGAVWVILIAFFCVGVWGRRGSARQKYLIRLRPKWPGQDLVPSVSTQVAIESGCTVIHAKTGESPPEGYQQRPGYFQEADGSREDAWIMVGAPLKLDYLKSGEGIDGGICNLEEDGWTPSPPELSRWWRG